jgi:hypothetical protein
VVFITHVPPGPVQAPQPPQVATVQQRPLTHPGVAHSSVPPQLPPAFLRHDPPAVQVRSPLHVPGSSTPDSFVQVPPAPVHASQVPQLARLQQRPSTQAALAHSVGIRQASPEVFTGKQRPPSQKLPAAQGRPAPQPPAQMAPSQVNGAQLTSAPGKQAPAPLQTDRVVATPAVHLPAAHSWSLPG